MVLFYMGLTQKKYIPAPLDVVYETQASSKTIGFPSRKMSVDSNYQTPDSPDDIPWTCLPAGHSTVKIKRRPSFACQNIAKLASYEIAIQLIMLLRNFWVNLIQMFFLLLQIYCIQCKYSFLELFPCLKTQFMKRDINSLRNFKFYKAVVAEIFHEYFVLQDSTFRVAKVVTVHDDLLTQ